jgi:hypothetical protein
MGAAGLRARRALSDWPGLLAWAVAIAGFGVWGMSVAGRVASPHPLEWMEGASLQHALRLLRGEPLYAAPTADFVAYLYPPLSYLPMALAVAIFGPSLPVARAPSLVLFALSLWAVARAARASAADSRAGVLSAGLWAAGYGYGGAFSDLARVDPLLLCLLAWGTERLIAQRLTSGLLLLALAAFAKQHGLLFLGAGCAWALLQHGRAATAAVVGSVAAVASLGGALQLWSGGWFLTYTWTLPRSHGLVPSLVFGYLGVYVALFLPVLAVSAGSELWRGRHAPSAVHWLLLSALAASALGRAHPGGDDNVLLPGYLLLCIVAAGPLLRGLTVGSSRRRAAVAAALVVQLALLWQAPSHHWPSLAARRGFDGLARALDECSAGGTRSALDFTGFTATSLAHTMALSDLRSDRTGALASAGTRALLQRLRGSRAPAALAVGASFPELDAVLDARYEPCRSLAQFPLATGYQPEAQRVWRLRRVR